MTALHLLQPTTSFNKIAPDAVIKIGAKFNKTYKSAKGRDARPRKKNIPQTASINPLVRRCFDVSILFNSNCFFANKIKPIKIVANIPRIKTI